MYRKSRDTSGTGWERFARRRRKKKQRVFPRDGTGKGFGLFTAGRERDGKVGSHLVDRTGRDYTISWWDGTDGTGSGNGSGI